MTAQRPSFSRMWSEPLPNDSSPQIERRPASMRLPKNFQPVRSYQLSISTALSKGGKEGKETTKTHP
jgi:hypothetical protein